MRPSAYDDRPEPAEQATAGVGPTSQAGGTPPGPGGSVGTASAEFRNAANAGTDDAYTGTEEDGGGARERMRHASERARHAARRRAREAAEAGRRTAWSARRRVRRAGSNVGHLIEERPLVVGLAGLAVGALLGALLPATRREDELLGETRDDLARRARAEIDKAERVAERAVDTARSEADQRDLTPDAARRAAANTVREAERAAEAEIKDVGEATREAAKAKRQDLGSGRPPNP